MDNKDRKRQTNFLISSIGDLVSLVYREKEEKKKRPPFCEWKKREISSMPCREDGKTPWNTNRWNAGWDIRPSKNERQEQ